MGLEVSKLSTCSHALKCGYKSHKLKTSCFILNNFTHRGHIMGSLQPQNIITCYQTLTQRCEQWVALYVGVNRCIEYRGRCAFISGRPQGWSRGTGERGVLRE